MVRSFEACFFVRDRAGWAVSGSEFSAVRRRGAAFCASVVIGPQGGESESDGGALGEGGRGTSAMMITEKERKETVLS